MDRITNLALVTATLALAASSGETHAETHVYEVVEETFNADNTYANPYLDVDLWVDLTGPGGTYKIPAFWDGGSTFRVRLVATKPGKWTWSSGNKTGDDGLDGKKGSFTAVAWTEAEKQANPNRRGFIRVAKNGRTLEYADAAPFFYTGDTWWSALTKVYAWAADDGVSKISFQDAIALRKAQRFNGINIIACFPSDTEKGIWDKASHGEKVAEDGSTPFKIDGGVDYTRINPKYWQHADRKMKHISEEGFVPFLETVRRHEAWPTENAAEKGAFTNYVRYLWARWGCYNMIFSWVHADAGNDELQRAWGAMVVKAHAELDNDGRLPYGQPRTVMCPGASDKYWYTLSPRILDINSVSNQGRDGECIGWLREMFFMDDPLPVYNLEPYYPGVGAWHPRPLEGMSDEQMAQFLMYGCVLNGGALAGHAWGDCYWAGVATHPKQPIPAGDPHKSGFNRFNAASMGKLKDFILDSGHDYRRLVPAPQNLATPDGELLCLALTPDKSQGLGFVSANRDSCDITKLTPSADYRIEWWHLDAGGWQNETLRKTNRGGRLSMPGVPGGVKRGWAFRILRVSDKYESAHDAYQARTPAKKEDP